MKYLYPFLFSLVVFLFAIACKQEYNSTQHGFKNTHEYPGLDEGMGAEPNTTDEGLYGGGNRWVWQKPNLVIKKLGDLTGKTVVDIGAGPFGYFAFGIAKLTNVEKVIAADIEEDALDFIIQAKEKMLPENIRDRIEARLVKADNPMLTPGEADVVLIVNTSIYFENRKEYFKNLRRGIAPGGKIFIVDFKKRNSPVGPSLDRKISLGTIEQELKEAGYTRINSDDRTLDYQYIVTAISE
ncbi:MAG: methyltransferase domain-containing protein [Bacteroidota bacterium]